MEQKILIVEDDPIHAKFLSLGLSKRGFTTYNARNGQEALEVLSHNWYDLVLLDIQMPELSGDQVLERLRLRYSAFELPIIIISAMDNTFDVVTYLKLGANDYIVKPTNIEVAIARINTQLNLVSLYRESLEKTELETLNSLIITYNHEINNPLTVAHGMLSRAIMKEDFSYLTKVEDALDRISEIVKKISELQEKTEITKVEYAPGQKMIKLK